MVFTVSEMNGVIPETLECFPLCLKWEPMEPSLGAAACGPDVGLFGKPAGLLSSHNDVSYKIYILTMVGNGCSSQVSIYLPWTRRRLGLKCLLHSTSYS